jgi:uncharacterized cupin superfamily protein
MTARPPFLVTMRDVAEEESRYAESPELLGYSRNIAKAVGLTKIGLNLERVPPGMRISYPHCHSSEDEFVLVLEGEIDAWVDGVLHPMKVGDLIGFPSGTGVCHTFINNSAAEAVLLGGGEAWKAGDQVHYPLNPERRAHMKPGREWIDPPLGPHGPHDGKPTPR